ncbi:MAG: dipeptide epimerase [Fuerstiella sp.]|nr:dipeptide epimerase [Fuerstiella sp.]MCP4854897.1 dipeptide epimerase [Fuerstiella sp.]
MKLRSLTAFEVPIELKAPFRHASHVRRHNDTLIVRCELADGSVGWGEGLPRTYVTGESIGSVWRHLEATNFEQLADVDFVSPVDAVAALAGFCLAKVPADQGVIPRECFGNSVRCAVELALLDAVCRSTDCSLGDVIFDLPAAPKLSERRGEVCYSGVMAAATGLRQWRSPLKMKMFGFRQVKIKVGTTGIDDVASVARARRILGQRVDLRLDANEAWDCGELVTKIQALEPFRPTCLEQPVPHCQVQGLADVKSHITTPIMLDESLCCEADARRAVAEGTCDLFNLRISKCGGILTCVRLAALARQHGLGYQLGCQVGETGILSAAGRHFACNIGQIRYLEGSYDRFLVRGSVTKEDLTFRFGGRAPRLDGPGLGITVDEAAIQHSAVRKRFLIGG